MKKNLQWCIYDEDDLRVYIDCRPTKEETLALAELKWSTYPQEVKESKKSFYVGLFNVEIINKCWYVLMEQDDGLPDEKCYEIAKVYK